MSSLSSVTSGNLSIQLNEEDLFELDKLAQATKGQDPMIKKAGYTAILNDVLHRTDTAIDMQKESQAYIQSSVKYMTGIVLVMALLLIANFALTLSAVEMSKESHVKSGAMTDTGGKIVQVGSSDFTLGSGGEIVQRASASTAASVGTAPVLSKYKLSSRTPNKYLEELDAFTVTRPCAKDAKNCNAASAMKVTVKSFKRQPSVGSHCGSVVVFQTDMGEFTLDDDNLYQGDSKMAAADGLFSLGDRRLANMNISTHGRRLMEEGAAPAVDVSVHGAFNFLGNVNADEFVCEMGGIIGKKFSVDPPKAPAVPYAYVVLNEGKCMFDKDDACESHLTQGLKPGATQHSNFTTMRTYEQVLLTQTHRLVVSYFASQPLSRLIQIIHIESQVYTQYLNFRTSGTKLSCITKPIEGGKKGSNFAVHLAYLSTADDEGHRSMRWALSPYNAKGSISHAYMEYWERVGTRAPRRIFQHGKSVISHGVSVDFFFTPKEFVEFSPGMTDDEVAQWIQSVLLLEVSQNLAEAAVCPDIEPAGMMPPYLGPYGEAGARWIAPLLQSGDLEQFGPAIRWSSSYYKYWSAVVATLGTPTVDSGAASIRGEESSGSGRRLSGALKRQSAASYGADPIRTAAYNAKGKQNKIDYPKSTADMKEFTECITTAKDCLTNQYCKDCYSKTSLCFRMMKEALGGIGANAVASKCSGDGQCSGGSNDFQIELACGPCTLGINGKKWPSFSCIFKGGSGCYWKTSSGALQLSVVSSLWEKWTEYAYLGTEHYMCPKSEIVKESGGDWIAFSCPDGTRVLSGGCDAKARPHKMQANYPHGNGWRCGGHGGGKDGKVVCAGRIGSTVVNRHGGDWVNVYCPGSHPKATGGGCYAKNRPHIVEANHPHNNNGWRCGGHGTDKEAFVVCVARAVPVSRHYKNGGDWNAQDCPSGKKLIGGGCHAPNRPHRFQVSWPLNDHAWQCGGHGGDKRNWVLCVPAAAMEGNEKCECPKKMAFTLTTQQTLCVPTAAGNEQCVIEFQGESCGGSKIKWTSMERIDAAPTSKWQRSGHQNFNDQWLGQCGVAPSQFPSVPRDCALCPSVIKFTASTTHASLCALPEGSSIAYSGVQCGGYGSDKIQWNSMRTLDPRSGFTTHQCTWDRDRSPQATGCSSTDIFITSHRNQQLEDQHGSLGLHSNRAGWQKWRLADAGEGTVFITSHRNQQLEDEHGSLGLNSNRAGWQKWRLVDAGGGLFYLVSHRNQRLEDDNGRLGLHSNHGAWQKWRVQSSSGAVPCFTSPSWHGKFVGYCGTAPLAVPTLPTTCSELTQAVAISSGSASQYDSFLQAHNGQYLDGALTTSAGRGDSKVWTQFSAGGGKIFLRSAQGSYISDVHGFIKMSDNTGGWEKWSKDGGGSGGDGIQKYYLKSHRNRYLSAPAGTYGCKICLSIDLAAAGMLIKICAGFDSGCWFFTEIKGERVPPPQWSKMTGVTITITGYIKLCAWPFSVNGWVKLQVERGFCVREWWTLGFTAAFSIYGYLKFEIQWRNDGSGVTLIGTAAVGVNGGVYRASSGWDIFGLVGRRRSNCDCNRVKSDGTISDCPQNAGASGQLTFTLKMWPCQKGKDAKLTGTISFALSLNLFGLKIDLPKIPDIQLFSTNLRKPWGS